MEKTLEQFLALPNVIEIKTLEEFNEKIINVNDLYSHIKLMKEYLPKDVVKCDDTSIIMLDCEDYNSAFLHEYYLEKLSDNEKFKDVNVFYIKSTDKFKQLIKDIHKHVDIPVNNYPNKKFEIMLMVFKFTDDGITFLWKTDDFGVINENDVYEAMQIAIK